MLYPKFDSAIGPIPHSDQLPVSVFTNFYGDSGDDDADHDVVSSSGEISASLPSDKEFVLSQANSKTLLPFLRQN